MIELLELLQTSLFYFDLGADLLLQLFDLLRCRRILIFKLTAVVSDRDVAVAQLVELLPQCKAFLAIGGALLR